MLRRALTQVALFRQRSSHRSLAAAVVTLTQGASRVYLAITIFPPRVEFTNRLAVAFPLTQLIRAAPSKGLALLR